jgi:hypothetical protein
LENIKGILDNALLNKELCPNIIAASKDYLDKNEINIYSYNSLLKKLLTYSDEVNCSEGLSNIILSYIEEFNNYFPEQLLDIE